MVDRRQDREEGKAMSARLIEVIEVFIHRGENDVANPHRLVAQYWSKEGKLLAERDAFHDFIGAARSSTEPPSSGEAKGREE
jgi:hypothetical protein